MVLGVRLAVAAFCLLTAGYAVLNCSPFAFDMFVRPQLSPFLTAFVAWHQLWFVGVYLASSLSLAPTLRRRAPAPAPGKAAHWLAVGYVLFFGLVGVWLVTVPYLPTLWSNARALPTALAAFLPLLWLAVIDHLSPPYWWGDVSARTATPHRLLASSAVVTAYLWGTHLVRALVHRDGGGSVTAWLFTGAWALVLTATVAAIVYALLATVAALAARTRYPARWEVPAYRWDSWPSGSANFSAAWRSRLFRSARSTGRAWPSWQG